MRLTISLIIFTILSALAQDKNSDRIESLINDSKYTEAIQEIETQLSQQKGSAVLLNNKKSLIYIMLGQFIEAEKNLNSILQNPSITNFEKAIILSTIGYLDLNKGNADRALENLQKAQTLFKEAEKSNTIESARCLSYLANLYLSTGKYNQAEDNQLISFQICSKLYSPDHSEMAAAYNDLGLVYSQIDADKALENYEKALPIYQKMYAESHPKIAIVSTNIGLMYLKLKLYGDAQINFETALSIWKRLYPNGHPNQALVLLNLGRTYEQLKNVKAAKGYYQSALLQFKRAYGTKHPDLASTYNLLGSLTISESKYDSSLYYFQQALISNSSNFNSSNTHENPGASSFYNGQVMLYTIRYKAQTLEEKYLNKTIKLSDLTEALSCLQVGDSIVDLLRQKSRDENDKIALGILANEVYEDGVRVAYNLSEITARPSLYKEQAFYFAEKSKSAVLLESIADANAKSFSGIPQEMIEEEKSLKAEIALYSQKLAQKPEAPKEQELRRALFSLTTEYESFIKQLEKDYPNYYNLKFNNSTIDTKSIRALIKPGTAVVSYFIAENENRLYSFNLTNQKFSITSKPLPEKFDRVVKGFNNSLFYSDQMIYSKTGYTLSELLKPKVNKSINDLIIIPSGQLGALPFEALPLDKEEKQGTFPLKFWVNRFSIGYEFSTSLLARKTEKKSQENANIFLCAPIQFSADQNLSELPGTETEVNFIANLFGNKAVVKKSNDATETMVKEASLDNYKFIHFATHGLVDAQSPELSRIFLKESDQDDGNLFSGEIYNLTLNADVIALSACQTGLGKISKGEGIIGLSRALVYAGARNIIVSYWSVADESTSQLMMNFYQNVLQSSQVDYRKSLQQVKIKMIDAKKYGAPFYWAPFVLIGF